MHRGLQNIGIVALLAVGGCCLSPTNGDDTSGSGSSSGVSATGSTTGPFGTAAGSSTGSSAGSSTGTATGSITGFSVGSTTGFPEGTSTGGSTTGRAGDGGGTLDAGEPCGDSSDCEPDLVCSPFSGTCTIPAGSPTHSCIGGAIVDPGCSPTVDGGDVGCNGTVCCNSFQIGPEGPTLTPCNTPDDCCSGNVCLKGICAIDDGEGYCDTYGPACGSGICSSSGACTCYGDGAQASDPLQCCSTNLNTGGVCASNATLAQTCSSDADCDQWQECDPDGGVCRLTSFGSAVEPCLTQEDCATYPAPLSCQDWGKCCSQPTGACLNDVDCCVGSVCDTQPLSGVLGVCKSHG